MMTFSPDPRVAEQQMHAIIYYLTGFGYIDGELDPTEKSFIRGHIQELVQQRARDALGDDAQANQDVIARWTKHFHEVFAEIDHQIQGLFTESVPDGEDPKDFVLAKIKLRCFELLDGFDDDNREALLATVDGLMLADGVIHPSEQNFRDELSALLAIAAEIDDLEIETIEQGAVVIDPATRKQARELDHPFFKAFEWDYATDPATFAEQAKVDLDLMRRFEEKLAEQRARGAGRLDGAADLASFAGQAPFLDGHVYVASPDPAQEVELLVVGDLHGCYSCLKAALMQADFFAKLQAYRDDPAHNPRIMLVFLGDYIDRGRFSYNGILRTVMQLFLVAPDNVFVLRGNHEYYVELNGRVLAPVRPSEAMSSLAAIAPNEVFAAYMRLFEALPNMLVFDRILFVHAGIPRDDTLAARWQSVSSLNDPEIRFQMLWSDPSEVDAIPAELQKSTARFPFGKRQFKSFMQKLGCTTLIRGHERIPEGFRVVYDDPDGVLLTLFSAGGRTNDDLPLTSNYREVTPMALTIRYKGGVSQLTPFVIEYERYNDPKYNAFFREQLPSLELSV
ncbi:MULTISPECIES: metallophosphoesterase family protein [Sorangium]|uniref:Serine/threonine protein phosphatase n=1 Tax=Sorangium cellulosum TaxID=56 RepID=A0A4P2R216_SORCE|nr:MULTISPECIES: metallophosphoesterase family protein [Sorangium]AUX37009.1 serine/threonine protein phosphatase [Sorangium cellulosum]WCQ96302.1 NinI-like serine-threonine phosphatase [Sorangium sp. Soce836]